ncbi:MAG: sulfite exporter TauE/SafE family protein [Acidimicrobiales bacterium]
MGLAGGLVGFTVGLTGMGGGALMTPMLVLLFSVNPGTAVSSDLLTSLVMKPVGGLVHSRQGTIEWPLVRWLVLGAAPAAFSGVFVLRALGHGAAVQHRIQTLLGWALIVAAVSMIAKVVISARSGRRLVDDEPVEVKRVATLLIGIVGGFVVGMTSVGSGSLMMVMLLLLYPRLTAKRLVGTDLVQAIPLVGSATIAHALFGNIDIGLTGSLLIGAIPGVYLGARVSSRAPDAIVRPALILILLGSSLKLLGLGTEPVGWSMLVFVLVALPLWGATHAATRPATDWVRYRRTTWVVGQSITAPFGIGALVSCVYFFRVRRSFPQHALAIPDVQLR